MTSPNLGTAEMEGTRYILTQANRLWLYEMTDRRRRGTPDCPGDMLWMRCLGECDAEGVVFDEEFAGGLTHLTPLQASRLTRVPQAQREVRAA